MDERTVTRTTKENTAEHSAVEDAAAEKSRKRAILFRDMVRGLRKYWWALAMVVAVCAPKWTT